ncbi:type I-C CRISPR-associated protein Cas7/Csd2 [Streptosporangium sp. NPDC001681]|uniref:type I-C CRISPR-associated protein Cas7/Csd2 n=1 Tax=Streptosporangium sp. NPDC001681 TaxID=3154395 RepID=UPI003320AB17
MPNEIPAHLDPARRHDIVMLFDVHDGNPNGDPDAGNQPRVDTETYQGLVTDVALKRKIRDTIPLLHPDDPRYKIFVEAGIALNSQIERGFVGTGVKPSKKATPQERDAVQQWMCDNFFDIRLFGGVLSTGDAQAGHVRGPLQINFARSISPIFPVDHAITRVTQTRQADIDKGEQTEMGSKWTVHYGLYRAHAYYSAARGQKTGVTSQDLDTLWQILANMFDHDRSATRGEMAIRGLYVFSHDNAFGRARASTLFDRVQVTLLNEGVPRSHNDYKVHIDDTNLPTGITLTSLI